MKNQRIQKFRKLIEKIEEEVSSIPPETTLNVVISVENARLILSEIDRLEQALKEIWYTEDFVTGGNTAEAMRSRAYAALNLSEGETFDDKQ